MEYQAIGNYAAIGNMRSLALVGKGGSIDFFCFPDFDSPSVFAALLDAKKGGAARSNYASSRAASTGDCK